MAAPPSSNPCASVLMFKNRLQEYTQKLGLPLPMYHTVNEGFPHAPLFRASVTIDEETFQSHHSFNHRKDAEQDVARLALEFVSKRMYDECTIMISKDTIFCKSILNEFMVKMNMEKPSYSTKQTTEGLLPAFVSSVVFDGVTYTGDAAKNKKEAEQTAARKVIQTILELACNSDHRNLLSEIIKSKIKLYADLSKNTVSKGESERVSIASGNVSSQISPLPMLCSEGLPAEQEVAQLSSEVTTKLKKAKVEYLGEAPSRSTDNLLPSNGRNALNQAINTALAEPTNQGNKVPLGAMSTHESVMDLAVGNLQKGASNSFGNVDEGSNQSLAAFVLKVNQAYGAVLANPSTQGSNVPLEVVNTCGPLGTALVNSDSRRGLSNKSSRPAEKSKRLKGNTS